MRLLLHFMLLSQVTSIFTRKLIKFGWAWYVCYQNLMEPLLMNLSIGIFYESNSNSDFLVRKLNGFSLMKNIDQWLMADSHKYLFHHNYFILFRCNLYYFSTLACDHLCQLQKSNNKDGKMFAEECLNSNFGVFVTFFLYYSSFSILQTPTVVIIILSRHHHMWLDYHVSQRKKWIFSNLT